MSGTRQTRPGINTYREVLSGNPSKGGERHAVVCCTSPRDCNPLREGHLLALSVGVEPIEEGQSAFYQGPQVREQPMVAILYPYLTVPPGVLPSGYTHGGSQDPCNRGIRGEFTRVAHGIPILR